MENMDASKDEKQINKEEDRKNAVLLYLHDFVAWLVAIVLIPLLSLIHTRRCLTIDPA